MSYDEPECTQTGVGDHIQKKHKQRLLREESTTKSRVPFANHVGREPNSGVLPRVPLSEASDHREKSILKSVSMCAAALNANSEFIRDY